VSVMSVRPFVTWYQRLIRLYDCREIRYRIFFCKKLSSKYKFHENLLCESDTLRRGK
jgi:hypothetical protein